MKRFPASQPVTGIAMSLISNIYSGVFRRVGVALRAVPLSSVSVVSVLNPVVYVRAFGIPSKVVKTVIGPLPIGMTALHAARARSRKRGQYKPVHGTSVMEKGVTVFADVALEDAPGMRVRPAVATDHHPVKAFDAPQCGYLVSSRSRHPQLHTGAGCAAMFFKARPAER